MKCEVRTEPAPRGAGFLSIFSHSPHVIKKYGLGGAVGAGIEAPRPPWSFGPSPHAVRGEDCHRSRKGLVFYCSGTIESEPESPLSTKGVAPMSASETLKQVQGRLGDFFSFRQVRTVRRVRAVGYVPSWGSACPGKKVGSGRRRLTVVSG